MTTTTFTDSHRAPRRWQAVAAASIGNALEWFDFAVYGFFAGTVAKLFFPSDDPSVSLLVALATFGVTFFIRPLGAVVLGNYADRHGRRAALSLTIVLMMLGTAIIAVAPTYAAIGVLAPALIVLARLIQGFSAGGEFGSATAFLAEQNPSRRGFYASWQFASQAMTTILATGCGVILAATLTPAQMENGGWRLPFVFGLLIGPVAWYIRRKLDETEEFSVLASGGASLREAFADSKLRMLVALGTVILCTVATYTILFMPTYAIRNLGLPPFGSFLATLITGAIQMVLIPVIGALSDRIGRLPITSLAAVAMAVLAYPLFHWLAATPTLQTLILVQAVIGVIAAGYLGALPALMSELFPTRMRTTGLSISYSFGVAIFGGFAPLISAWLIRVTGTNLAPSFYLIFAAIISLVSLAGVRRFGIR